MKLYALCHWATAPHYGTDGIRTRDLVLLRDVVPPAFVTKDIWNDKIDRTLFTELQPLPVAENRTRDLPPERAL